MKCRSIHLVPSSLWPGTTWETFPRCCSSFSFGCKKVPQLQGRNLKKKEVPITNRFSISYVGTVNMVRPKNKGMVPMLWHLLLLSQVMCKKAQQGNDCWGCHNSHGHLHSADAQSFVLPSPKEILRENSCQTEVMRGPSVFCHSSKYKDF